MQLVLTYFIILTCLVVDSDVAMDPGILELKGDQEAKGTLATLDLQVLSILWILGFLRLILPGYPLT